MVQKNYEEIQQLDPSHPSSRGKMLLNDLYMNLQLDLEEKVGKASDFNEQFNELEKFITSQKSITAQASPNQAQ